jgi:hypothetical protein
MGIATAVFVGVAEAGCGNVSGFAAEEAVLLPGALIGSAQLRQRRPAFVRHGAAVTVVDAVVSAVASWHAIQADRFAALQRLGDVAETLIGARAGLACLFGSTMFLAATAKDGCRGE